MERFFRTLGMALAAAGHAVPALAAGGTAHGAGADIRGVTENEIVVGTHLDLTGPIAAWGVAIRNGMTLAIEEANELGGVRGRKVRLVVEDTGYGAERAIAAVAKLVDRDRVFAILNPLGTPTVQASMAHALEQGVLHLFPFTPARQAYLPFDRLKFATTTPYGMQAAAGLKYFLDARGPLRVATLVQDDAFGAEVAEAANAELSRRGLAAGGSETFVRGETEFGPVIGKLKSTGAELVVLGSVVRETIAAMTAARKLGWHPIFLCTAACYAPETASLGGNAVEGLNAVAQFAVPTSDDPNPDIRNWVRRYERKYGTVASMHALQAYAQTRFFLDALELAPEPPSQEMFAMTLEEMEPWRDERLGGVPIDFTPEDHLGVRTGNLMRIRSGRWTTVAGPLETPTR